MSLKVLGALNFLCSLIFYVSAQNWRGNIESYQRWEWRTCSYCLCRYSWGCSAWRYDNCLALVNSYRCINGWRHTGNYDCSIPICLPNCGVGECKLPNTCDCKGQAEGQFCQTLICSYARPCYPGNCYDNDKCNCTSGFAKESAYGCLNLAPDNKPTVGKSTIIISHIRSTDSKLIYNFRLDGTNDGQNSVMSRTVWSNQRIFNKMDFEFEATFNLPEELPERPAYVHSVKLGIVEANVTLRIRNYLGVEHPVQKYDFKCPASASIVYNPPLLFNCTVRNEEFKTLIEHADTLEVTFVAVNGGSRTLNEQGNLKPPEKFLGQEATKMVFFKFDFQAPLHCTEGGYSNLTHTITDCANVTVLGIQSEFTKKPIKVQWKGWTDDLYGSQMWMYYLELHKLVVTDITKELTELNPIGPMDSKEVMHSGQAWHSVEFIPKEPGMYSVLMEARDISNNSRIARRLVLFDNVSDVELNADQTKQLYIATAAKETSYNWQSKGSEDSNTTITFRWDSFFMNKLHEEKFLLNEVRMFPVQFKNLEDDGILYAKKFVDSSLDDSEGERTLDPIPNIHGIIKFEYQYSNIVSQSGPMESWINVSPLAESQTIMEQVKSGDQLKVWVRGTDVLGNSKVGSTHVTFDFTPPVTNDASKRLDYNIKDMKGRYNYSSRIQFEAYDHESSVHQIGLYFEIHIPDMQSRTTAVMLDSANTDITLRPDKNPLCEAAIDKSTCYIRNQTVFFDNCMLMVPNKQYLTVASATVYALAYNQAMLTRSLTFQIPKISDLNGLQQYTGPENIRIENIKSDSFRIAWDQPKVFSCYGHADIVLVLFVTKVSGVVELVTQTVSSSSSYFDFASLDPETDYTVKFASALGGGGVTDALNFKARTVSETKPGASVGLIVGVAVGVIVAVAIALVIFIILVRRGVIHPVERARTVKRAVTRKYRQTVYGDASRVNRRAKGKSNPTYDPTSEGTPYDNNRQSEFYIYGGMDINASNIQHIDRDSITFKSVIKDGHFARIYLASWQKDNGEETVVAKTLKQHFKPADETNMKAKISFSGTVVGDHHNVLKFLGAVTGDEAMGPFIIYEYCENGTLKDYLVAHKNNVSIELQESLFRFGLDIAKGMEYLASKGIVHRRLAARNILLTFLNEVKIAGFGPQPDEEMDEADSNKQERIPVKWMPPECFSSTRDATEKSDVWSYAVVLWEIFTLGETPYDKIRSRDLPTKLKKGFRLHKPEQCDDTWYGVMTRCWTFEHAQRPSFSEVRNELDSMFTSSGEEYYYYKR